MPTPKEELISIHQILHLTHHRNQNQHRLSKWYKSFSQLRRQIAKLIAELESLEIAKTYSSARKMGEAKENKYMKAAREKVELRVRFLGEWLVGGCFLAFSNLVADNQYSALGLMLLGMLARVKSVLVRVMVEEGMGEGFAEIVETVGMESNLSHREVDVAAAGGDDLGVVVKREEIVGDHEDIREDLNEDGNSKVTKEVLRQSVKEKVRMKRIGPPLDRDGQLPGQESTPSKPTKKKRKKGDAFDDLFDSLL